MSSKNADVLPREGLVTADRAAQYLSIPVRQLYKDVRKGRLPFVRVGRRIRFSARALRTFADAPSVSRTGFRSEIRKGGRHGK